MEEPQFSHGPRVTDAHGRVWEKIDSYRWRWVRPDRTEFTCEWPWLEEFCAPLTGTHE